MSIALRILIMTSAVFAVVACAPKPALAKQPATVTCTDRGCSDWAATASNRVEKINKSRPARVARAPQKARPAPAQTALEAIVAPGRYIAGRLVCAVNVNAELARRGIRGTGSALAKSFLSWGRPSAPVPGAVAVYNRGKSKVKGHVAIVSRVVGSTVYVLNPGRGGWREVVYPRPAIAYRAPA